MVAGEEELSENENQGNRRISDVDCQMQYLKEKLCRLERMLSGKERRCVDENTAVTLEGGKEDDTHMIPIHEDVRSEKAFRDEIAVFEDFQEDCYQNSEKKLSILELYRDLQMIEENHKYFYEESENYPKSFQKYAGSKCETKNHSYFGHFPYKKGNKKLISSHYREKNSRYNSTVVCSSDESISNTKLKSTRSKLNVSAETKNRQVPFIKTRCSCREISRSSSDDSEESFYKCSHLTKERLNESYHYKKEDVESETSNEDETTYSEVSKYTCYCSKNHSHGESSEADSDLDVCQEKKVKPERFRGGLDVVSSNSRKITEYDKNLKERKYGQAAANVAVDNIKLLKVKELREGLERLKIRNRNLRDFLDTLQNPINLTGKPSEANTICTQVSSCYTFDIARQTRSGLLTVVEVLKGKCQSKDAVIVALADELKIGSDNKIDVLGPEKEKILTEDKSLIWNGLMEEKNSSRKFTKKDSAIGFAVFLMILISHVKRSEMISYLSAAKKILTASPFKLGLFINEAESYSIDFIYTYYQDLAHSFQYFVKYSLDRWANLALHFNLWFVSYYADFKQHFDAKNNFLVANQSFVLPAVFAIFIGILMMNIKKVWVNRMISVEICGKIPSSFKSFAFKLSEFIISFGPKILSSKIFWFSIGFCSQSLWNLVQTDLYEFLKSLEIYYIKNTNHLLYKNLNETEKITDGDCKLFDKFDYSWVASIFYNKFQSFVQFAYYILKNI